jgi:hypothetical protein
MTLSVPPILPEDRKHLDIPLMPAPRTRFQKDGKVWELVNMSLQREELPGVRAKSKLTLEFVAVDTVKSV